MKNLHRNVLKKLGLTAFAIGALGMNTCFADDIANPDGISMQLLNQTVQNLEIKQSGHEISFAGLIPKYCAEGATMDYQGAKSGKQILMVHMPNCEKGEKLTDEQKSLGMASLSSIFHPITMLDKSGQIVLRSLRAGDPNSSNRVQDDALVDESGKQFMIVSSADQRLIDDNNEIDALLKNVEDHCKNGNAADIGQDIAGAVGVLGDVRDIMDAVNAAEVEKLQADLASAEKPAEAKAAYQKLDAFARDNGLDGKPILAAYLTQRLNILQNEIEDTASGDVKPQAVDNELMAFQRELKRIDRKTYIGNLDNIAGLYANLAMAVGKKKDYNSAISYYTKGKELVRSDEVKAKFDDQIKTANIAQGNMYKKVHDDCLAKNPANVGVCDKYANMSRNSADNAKDILADAANSPTATEEDKAAYEAFLVKYAGTFGAGGQYMLPQYGQHSEVVGSMEMKKIKTVQEYQAQQQILMQQRMMGGGQQQGAPQASGSLFD